jgi:phosphatidylserine/phosphatidylglycerophosphate/cardiolipin synthase-like enzyme
VPDALADPSPVIHCAGTHYAPAENLEQIDVACIDLAQHEIDFAAYIFTDWPIMQALARASERGVKVRIYLDVAHIGKSTSTKHFRNLAQNPSIKIRFKGDKPINHLKSYQIDGSVFRTGTANFTVAGLKKQENNLVVTENAEDAAAFKRNFDTYYGRGFVLLLGADQLREAGCITSRLPARGQNPAPPSLALAR